MSGVAHEVPRLPPLPDPLVLAHDRAHAELADRFTVAGPAVQRAFVSLSRRLLVEGLANLQPVLADPTRPLLVPPPRRFLTTTLAARKLGSAAAFRHIDSKVEMYRAGSVPAMIEPSTPEVLNALLQASIDDTDRETNRGIVRATPTSWAAEANPFEHPPPASCRALLSSAIAMAADAPAPPIAKAGWLTFTLMTVHPFLDGNGRTARACGLAVVAPHLPLGVDWGVLEQWSLDRRGYIAALKVGQRAARYSADAVDAAPFMEYTARSSIDGVVRSTARLELLTRAAEHLASFGLHDDEVETVLLVATDRYWPIASNAIAPGRAGGTDRLFSLVRNGVLAWADAPAGAERSDSGVVPGPVAADLVHAFAHERVVANYSS